MHVHARQYDGHSVTFASIAENLKVMDAGAVDERYLPHPNDTNLVLFSDNGLVNLIEFVCYSEEVRPIDFIHLNAFRDMEFLFMNGHIDILSGVNLIMERADNR